MTIERVTAAEVYEEELAGDSLGITERLAEHLQVGSPFYWHPNRRVPGVDVPR